MPVVQPGAQNDPQGWTQAALTRTNHCPVRAMPWTFERTLSMVRVVPNDEGFELALKGRAE